MRNFTYLLLFICSIVKLSAQCPDPSNISLSAVTETTADILWQENGTANTWNVEIVLAGDPQVAPTDQAFTTSYDFINLLSGTSYDVYIQSDCAASGVSNWVGPFNFTTLDCVISIQGVAQQDSCLEYCFYATGGQFGTFFDFNSNTLPTGWNASPFTVGTPCVTQMVDNTPYFWASTTDVNGIRQVSTNPLDVSIGGVIQFFMRFGSDDPDPGCEDPDLPEEGVTLQYSIDGGATWVNMNYWAPTGIFSNPLYSWNQYTETIPVAAQTANTIFRWYQEANSGAQFDNWGLDNILVSASTNANYNWDLGDGTISTEASPCHTYATPGDYTVALTLGSPNCNSSDTITITVADSELPNVICQNFDLVLDINGNGTLQVSDIDNGSTDNCGIQTYSLSQTNFSCNDLGNNTVILTVTDTSNNVSTCNATVNVLPLYQAPTNVTVISTTTDSATINWTPVTGETAWTVEVVPAFSAPTGTGVVTSTIPYIATGLSPNTTYDVYITPSSSFPCPGTVGPIRFSTPCVTIGVPYIETVEMQPLGGSEVITNCWSANTDTAFEWLVNSGPTGSTGTGPDNAAFGSNYFYTEATFGTTGQEAVLLSPVFDLTTSTNTFMHFYYHMYGAAMGSLRVDVFNGTTWDNDFFVITGQQQTDNDSPWLQQFLDISAYETVNNFRVRFRGIKGSSFTSDMAIDNFVIESITCPAPTMFTATAISGTDVLLAWNDNPAITQWEIEAVPAGTPPTGTGIAVTTNPYTYTGLNPNTEYDFYIRTECSPTDSSSWVGPVSATTLCATFPVPYLHGVESQTTGPNAIAQCWTASNTSFAWEARTGGTPSGSTGPSAAAVGTHYFYTEASSGSTGNTAELVSPVFDLSTLTDLRLKFFYHMYGAAMGSLHVDVFDGLSWVNDFYVITGQQQTSNGAAWILEDLDIDAYQGVSNFMVRFRGIRGTSFTSDMAIDEFEITGNLCPQPINLMVSNETNDSIDISWTETGTATEWLVEAVPTGTPPLGASFAVTDNPYTFNGLSPNTTYDFYVTASCSVTSTSPTSGPVTGTTFVPCDDISFTFCPTDVTIDTDANECFGTPNFTLPTILDNCDATNTTVNLVTGFGPDGQFPIGTTLVEYEATNSAGTTITCSFNVIVNDPFTGLQLTSNQPIVANVITLCNQDTADLILSGGNFDGTETYSWMRDTNVLSETSNTLSNVNQSGDYEVTVNLGSCSQVFSVTVNQFDGDASFTYSNIDCTTATPTISGTAGGTFSFNVVPNDNAVIDAGTGIITNGTEGDSYSVTYTTPFNPCQSSNTVMVSLLDLDDASFEIEDNSISCESATVTILSSSNGTFAIDSPLNTNAEINPTTGEMTNLSADTSYTISFTTNQNCTNVSYETFTTNSNCIIPQGISPNNDGLNDYFDLSFMDIDKISIFNRFGNEVYIKANYKKEWNGKDMNDNDLPTGTYFYVININGKEPISGWVYINR
jgi:gliding motility-associated-like protein